jgi:hypothetical protein
VIGGVLHVVLGQRHAGEGQLAVRLLDWIIHGRSLAGGVEGLEGMIFCFGSAPIKSGL